VASHGPRELLIRPAREGCLPHLAPPSALAFAAGRVAAHTEAMFLAVVTLQEEHVGAGRAQLRVLQQGWPLVKWLDISSPSESGDTLNLVAFVIFEQGLTGL